jgi:hypothetical protein
MWMAGANGIDTFLVNVGALHQNLPAPVAELADLQAKRANECQHRSKHAGKQAATHDFGAFG